MSSNSTSHACDSRVPEAEQAALAPFLRPTITDEDPSWYAIESMSHADKIALIKGTTDENTVPSAMPLSTPGKDFDPDAIKVRADLFGRAMLAQFDQYLANDEISDEYYCAAVNFLAFAKWSDLDAVAEILKANFVHYPTLEEVCKSMLGAAVTMGRLCFVPQVFVLNSEKFEIRLMPYAGLVALFINSKQMETPEGLVFAAIHFAIYHEIAHYVFWNGTIDGATTLEAWTREQVKDLDKSEQAEAYLAFEEVFCDSVGVAVGGAKCAESIMTAIVSAKSLPFGSFGRNRLIALLRGVKSLYPKKYNDFFAETLGSLRDAKHDLVDDKEVTNTKALYLEYLADASIVKYLEAYRDSTEDIRPTVDLLISTKTSGRIINSVVSVNAAFRRDGLIKQWHAELDRVDFSVDLQKVYTDKGIPPPLNYPDPQELLTKFKQNAKSNPIKIFNAEWFSVLQADGWGSRPTKNNIGT